MDDSLVEKLRKWLGEDGVTYFRDVKKEYGRLDAIFKVEYGEGRYFPYSVHFHEGMQVRNFLRGCRETVCWKASDFDDRWIEFVEKAIKE